jgi:hypothetical protein
LGTSYVEYGRVTADGEVVLVPPKKQSPPRAPRNDTCTTIGFLTPRRPQ